MITPQSRYNQGTVVRVPNAAGTYNLTVLRTIHRSLSSFSLYIWKETDRPDLVASRELNNPGLWWAIFDLNPELIYPLNIPPGTMIRIPRGPVMGQGTLRQ